MARGHLGFQGTTSACAENTLRHHSTRMLCGNYLRVRGEYARSRSLRGGRGELPPRARRIRLTHQVAGFVQGTTSACAENTEINPMLYPNMLELPPRARRILIGSPGHALIEGTTSACAENTTGRCGRSRPTRNYLRVRGEYPHLRIALLFRHELPPRARRIHFHHHFKNVTHGTTSACAENTSNSPSSSASTWNYLRVRGEYASSRPTY